MSWRHSIGRPCQERWHLDRHHRLLAERADGGGGFRRREHGDPQLHPVVPIFADAADPGPGRDRMGCRQRFHHDRHSALHHDGRGAHALGDRRAHVRIHAAVALLPAGRADERQHRILRGLFRQFRIRRGDGGDHRDRRHPGDETERLQRAAVSRNAGGRRDARHPHSALHQSHRLRRAHRNIDPAALPCRVSSRASSWPR